jgi:hypothetical protein
MVSPSVDQAEADIAKAKRAAAFLEQDGVFAEAWQELDARIVNQWRLSKDASERERLHALTLAMTGLQNILAGYVENGALSLARLRDNDTAQAAYT